MGRPVMDDRPPITHPNLRVSVVVPAHNAAHDLKRCLVAIRAGDRTPDELIVVDDGSTDATSDVATQHGARVVRHHRALGPSAARNTGAQAASGDLLAFFDADVIPHRDALARAVTHLERHPEIDGVFGSYDDHPEAVGLLSRFRNLWHHHIHHRGEFDAEGARPASTFWTGVGVLRRARFLELGGFDARRYPRPSIEDIEFGYRLTDQGGRLQLMPAIQATHLKRWTLFDTIRTDIFKRGVPWLILLRSRTAPQTDLNLDPRQKWAAALVAAGVACLPATFWYPGFALGFALTTFVMILINRSFFQLAARRFGLGFALGCVPCLLVYYGCCLASVPIAWLVIRWAGIDTRLRPIPIATIPAPHQPTGTRQWVEPPHATR